MDYYQTLGVTKTASQAEIKKAYKHLAQQYHPDKNTDTGSEEKFKEIQKAYSTLKDPDKRALYDNPHQQQFNTPNNGFSFRTGDGVHVNINSTGFGGVDVDALLDALHGSRFGHRRKQQPMAKVVISLEEAYTGTTRTLNNNEFSIPPGVRTGNKLAVDEFIVVIQVQEHSKFKRVNDDLVVKVEVTAVEAMIGIECQVTGLDDKNIKFKIPQGTQYGQLIRLRGKGMPNPEINYIGDLLIQIVIKIPDDLTNKELESIMKLPHRDIINV